jgi:hypothetical protein
MRSLHKGKFSNKNWIPACAGMIILMQLFSGKNMLLNSLLPKKNKLLFIFYEGVYTKVNDRIKNKKSAVIFWQK